MDNREPINVMDYKEVHKKAISEINKSNFILKGNLIKQLLEGNGEVDLSQITSTKIPIDKTIKQTNNTIEDLDKQLEDEYTTLAVDLKMIDEEIFLWGRYSFEELAKWLEENENAYIVANAKKTIKKYSQR